MEIVENKALLLTLRNPQRVVEVIPKSKLIEDNKVLVKWGLDEAQVLKNLKIRNVPSPILGHYDWPGQYKPFEHQKITAGFLTLHKRAFCFNEQGTGKTGSVIWATDYLLKQGKINRVLVICPVSIMDSAWRADLFKFAMHRHVDIAYGTADKRRKIIAGEAEYIIINYDGVEIVKDEIAKGGFDMIVVDEASAYKNAQSKRWKVLNSLLKPDTWLWMLTGTPAAQSPLDAYGIAKLVNPTAVPKFYSSFREMVMYKVTNFKWQPKESATKIVFSALQPAIRFTKDECLDLPDMTYVKREVALTRQQEKYYKMLKNRMIMEAAGEEITSVNAAVNMNKLLQISCIAYNTDVLTDKGWIPIQDVTHIHKVWDGEAWVVQDGAVYKGTKSLVMVDGVRLTGDHKVWIGRWVTAKEIVNGNASGRFNRPTVRLPDSFAPCSHGNDKIKDGTVGLPVRLWKHCGASESISTQYCEAGTSQLWVSPREQHTQYVEQPTIPYMGAYAKTLYGCYSQGLQKLRSTWDNCMRVMEGVIRSILGGHGGYILSGVNVRQERQQRPIQPEKLPMGNRKATVKQHTPKYMAGYTFRENDSYTSSGSLQHKTCNVIRKTEQVQVASYAGVDRVYDLVNCGPRNRFTVRGVSGIPLIVHNCGAVYADSKDVIEFDISNRYRALMEVIEEASQKVLVFVPYKHIIDILATKLNADGVTTEVISGSVSVSKRTDIFNRFQTTQNPRVLVIQPQAAAHGVTLTAANTVVWWGPVSSLETYAQANARVHRAGQRHPSTVVQLQGSPVERHVYSLLDNKIDVHSKMIDLYRGLLV